ncbi:hypothetical protein HK414_24445 [Ramlibacter terrae]|uniref:Uncharacterized protein n=1 Tax=Ramlibacter terrae TaxID=2732511 RepID=A0ABX6P5E8_9BURK|nr:hypothetical protein HK414_24445 [Ramlibacter terrae]
MPEFPLQHGDPPRMHAEPPKGEQFTFVAVEGRGGLEGRDTVALHRSSVVRCW